MRKVKGEYVFLVFYVIAVTIVFWSMYLTAVDTYLATKNDNSKTYTRLTETIEDTSRLVEEKAKKPAEAKEPEESIDYGLTNEEIELVALITMAEVENQSEYVQRLVIDTILNRVDHEHWPDTVDEVIYQRNQFTCVWNGRVDRCYVKEELCDLVKEELLSRTNHEVVFFRTERFSDYGTPLFKAGDCYFSKF